MPITMEEFIRQANKRAIAQSSIEDRLEGVPAEEMRKRMTAEERLEGIAPEKRLEGITPEQCLVGFSAEDRESLRQMLNEPPKS